MPHDQNGKLIKAGDRVSVPCTIKSVDAGPDYCNVSVETVHPMHPSKEKSSFSLNSKQVIKDDKDAAAGDDGGPKTASDPPPGPPGGGG